MAKEYNISRSSGVCCRTGRELAVGEEYVATVREEGEDLVREDWCLDSWNELSDEQRDQLALLGCWRAHVPEPREKKKTFVDDDVLVQFIERLADAAEPAKIQFRFVLALVLMRKKKLTYEGARTVDGVEVWSMKLRGQDTVFEVVDPHMDEQKIADVSEHLGQILEAEL